MTVFYVGVDSTNKNVFTLAQNKSGPSYNSPLFMGTK